MPAGVGRTLREARIRAGVELTDVEAQTGINAKYLRALEWERFDLLPDFDYARKAAKAEARVLQLDPESMSAEFDRTIATAPRHGPPPERTPTAPATAQPEATEPPPKDAELATVAAATSAATDDVPAADPLPEPLPPAEASAEDSQRFTSPWSTSGARWRDLPVRRLIAGALVAGLVAFLIVDLFVLRDDESSGVPATEQPVDASPSTAAPPAPTAGSSVGPGAASADPAEAGPATAGAGHEQGVSNSGPPAGAATEEGADPASAATGTAGPEPATGDGGPSATAPPAVQQVEIRTPRGESWLQVRKGTRTGPVLYEGLVPRGSTLNFEERALHIRAGAIAVIDIRQDGTLVSEGLEGTLDLKLTRANGLRVVS